MGVRSRGLWVAVALLPLAGFACESSNDPGRDETGPADVADVADPGAEAVVDTVTGATKLVLADTHDGWKQAACWSCHTADDHNDGKDPYLCVGCHGTNGAPAGHVKTTPCSTCHSTPPHGAEGFPDPLSCQTCHAF